MLTDKQIIKAARECGFMAYEDDNIVMLSEPLTNFARLIERLCTDQQRTPIAHFRTNDKAQV